jgi:hypothetical protein
MDNPNSMLGLLGMESTSFLEELTRSDDLSPMPQQSGVANGTVLPSGDQGGGNTVGGACVEMQQQRQQMQASMWGMGQQSSVHYGSQEHAQFGALKQQQQQRMGQISGYGGGGMMPVGNGGVLQAQAGGNYSYGGMAVNPSAAAATA